MIEFLQAPLKLGRTFLVPTASLGFMVERAEHKMGLHGSDTCAIALDDCRIPQENLLGEGRNPQ